MCRCFFFIERYQKIPGKVVQYNNDAVLRNIKTADACANACNSNPNFTCNSFEFCFTSQVCTLSKIHTSDGNVVSSTQQCDLYDRGFKKKYLCLDYCLFTYTLNCYIDSILLYWQIPYQYNDILASKHYLSLIYTS